MTRLTNPMPLFLDVRGALLDAGSIYVGVAGSDPEIEANRIALFWDAAMTIPALQPLRTLGGRVVNGSTPAFIYYAEEDASLKIVAADSELVDFLPTTASLGIAYQPLDPDLTAIAALGTTAFGRSLLTLANAAALKAATGIPDCLPLTGGTVSGPINRQGAGVHVYHADAELTSGRIFLTASGASDPTSLPGDIWLTY